MRLFELESDENSIYFVFINSNPPTFGYKRAMDTLLSLSKDSEHIVFINPAHDGENFPLEHKELIEYNKKIFKNVNFYNKSDVQNPIQALKYLSEKYSKVYFVTRDNTINDYRRMYQYAENWGIDSFDIIGLGDSKRPLPTGTSKEVAMNAVMDNDYDAFKSAIPSNDKTVLSNLFIALRKQVLNDRTEKVDVDESFLCLSAIAKHGKYVMLESSSHDQLGNKVIHLENFIDRFKGIKLVLSNCFKGITVGQDTDSNYVLMMKTDARKLEQFLELHEEKVKSVLRYLHESITSSSVASSTTLFGEPIKRDIDYSFLTDIKKSNSLNKKLDAINYVLNNYHFIDKSVVTHIEDELSEH